MEEKFYNELNVYIKFFNLYKSVVDDLEVKSNELIWVVEELYKFLKEVGEVNKVI